MSLVFEWDPRKARTNLRKHGVSFTEAASVFTDPLARILLDEEHSAVESREIIIGHSSAKSLLLVSFVELEIGQIRIIGARRATRKEQNDYEENAPN
ncbi:conserved hypothetical protein [Candidatus Sulfopaludibacter sp. SbA3]|nr:conserved hypothetical protein [Candidatus Sulfopaludibacter sp. SbA3]